MKLFIAGLPSDFDDIDLKEMFELYGIVSSAKVIVDHNTQKSKGFGFLDMPNQTEATAVISILNGVKMAGKPLVIKEATEQPQKPMNSGGFRPQRNNDAPRPRYNNNRGEGGIYSRDSNGGGYSRDNRGSYNRDSNNRDYERNNNRDRQSGNRY